MYVISAECDVQYENAKWEYEGNSAYILHRDYIVIMAMRPGAMPIGERDVLI